jgi:hypothetical protein
MPSPWFSLCAPFFQRLKGSLLLLTALAGCPDPLRAQNVEELRLNQLQMLGSHNSYRLSTHPPLLALLAKISGFLPGGLDARGWDYSHEPLPAQLSDYGVRSVELDVYLDTKGGLFANRQGNRLVGEPAASGVPELDQPGMKILHFPDLDYRTNYPTFRSALTAVKSWSDTHPDHLPIIVHLETKDESGKGRIPLKGLTAPEPWDAPACAALDAEIAAIFPRERCFVPDDLRGTHSTLEVAARAQAWPTLKAVRGRVLFVMEGAANRPYAADHPSLRGRTCFLYYGRPGAPEAAFLLMNDPLRQGGAFHDRVGEGYFVRTRADTDTTEARTGDTRRREASWASGAQIVSTDYYRPDPRAGREPGWTDYTARIPGGGIARVNPVSGPVSDLGKPIAERKK